MKPPINYVILLISSSLMSLFSGLYSWRKRRYEGLQAVMGPLLLLDGGIWSLSGALELLVQDPTSKLLFVKTQYSCVSLIGTGWLIYSLYHIGLERWLKRRTLALMSITSMAFILLIFTNEYHGLFFTSDLISVDRFSLFQAGYGLGFWVLVGYTLGLLLVASYFSLRRLVRLRHINYRHVKAILIIALIPWIGSIAVIFDFLPKGFLLTPLVYNLIGVSFVILKPFEVEPQDVIPLARESVFDNMRDYVIILDEDDKVMDMNTAAQQLLGCTPPETSGQTIDQLISNRFDTEFNINELRGDQEIKIGEVEEERVYDVIISTLADDFGWFKGKILVIHDVTTQRRAQAYWEERQKLYSEYLERTVEERTKDLRNAERLATIGEMASIIGHDLRNPLTGIAGAAYYLKKKEGPDIEEEKEKMFEIIERSIEASNNIITDLLEYSRELNLEFQNVEIRRLIEDSLATMDIPDGVEVSNQAEEGTEVCVDQLKMKRVFINLFQNAIDAMPEGGRIDVESRKLGMDLEVAVIDTGSGISEEIMDKIWTPLFTTKEKGMGFGLAICRKIAEAHGGSITVESDVGTGTRFKLTLPLSEMMNYYTSRILSTDPVQKSSDAYPV